MIYDIESDPDTNEDFLHGFITIKRKSDGSWNPLIAKYHPILTLKEHGKSTCWKRIKRKITLYKDWPILHYGETEGVSILRLATSEGESITDIETFRNRFIDIHSRLRANWRLPLNSYGLKAVANWTGFEWKQKGAEGAKALLWWRQWRATANNSQRAKNTLKRILKYNEDDCLATWSVTEWLLKNDSNLSRNYFSKEQN